MLYTKTAKGSVDEVTEKLANATTANGFGVLGEHNLKERMTAKGVPFASECRILEVCNPMQAKSVLETNIAISTALPCWIAVYEESDVVKVSALRPTALLRMFGNPELGNVAEEVEGVMIRIIDSACA